MIVVTNLTPHSALLHVHLWKCVRAYVQTILNMRINPKAAVPFPSSVFWPMKRGFQNKEKQPHSLEGRSPLIEVPLYPDAAQRVLMSPQYVSRVGPLHPLNWVFQPPN